MKYFFFLFDIRVQVSNTSSGAKNGPMAQLFPKDYVLT